MVNTPPNLVGISSCCGAASRVVSWTTTASDRSGKCFQVPGLQGFPSDYRDFGPARRVLARRVRTSGAAPDPTPMTTAANPLDLPPVDTSRKFVRVLGRRADGLVSFEFSIGWPELAVELLLPAAAFAEFCSANRVTFLDPQAGDGPATPTEPTTEETRE
jgi:phenol hydroxylase P0 protein